MYKIRKAVILAGGRGTRLKPFTDTAPKPMFPINNIPFLEYLLKQVKSFGITEVIILLGYLPDRVIDYFGGGESLGLNIRYSVTEEENETQRRIYLAKELIKSDFLLMYCDNYCPVNFKKLSKQFYESGSLVQITAYSNKDGYTKNNLLVNDKNVIVYDKSRKSQGLNGVDIGYALIKKDVLEMICDENISFEKNIYSRVLELGKLSAYMTDHRYYSIGSYERIELTKQFFSKEKIAFVDRDGTLNVKPPKAEYVTNADSFIWIEGAKKAIKLLNDNNYKVFLITNQPGIARDMLTEKALEEIHDKLAADLAKAGAKIDNIYICPHGWNDNCDCRKPKSGLLYNAQKEFNFNMKNAVFFGDDERDMQAAEAADCKGIFITDEYPLIKAVEEVIKWQY